MSSEFMPTREQIARACRPSLFDQAASIAVWHLPHVLLVAVAVAVALLFTPWAMVLAAGAGAYLAVSVTGEVARRREVFRRAELRQVMRAIRLGEGVAR